MRIRILTVAASIGLLVSCAEQNIAPFDKTDTGLLALEWGMDPETAKAYVMGMKDVTAEFDTVETFEDYYHAAYMSTDTVEALLERLPGETTRWQNFTGGTFFGQGVRHWSLVFGDASRLREVGFALDASERGKLVMSRLEQRFRERYTSLPPVGGDMGLRFSSRGFGGSRDTTLPANTIVTLWHNERREAIIVSYRDKAYLDSLDRLWEQRQPKRVRISVEEWEKFKKEDKKSRQ